MDKNDLRRIKELAQSDDGLPSGWTVMSAECADRIHDPDCRVVTLEQAASFVRWQALQFNGEFDHDALAEALELLRPMLTV